VNLQQGIIKDLSVKLLAKWCQLVRVATSLLHANYKENLMTRFSAKKQTETNFKGLFIFIHVAIAATHTSA